MFFLRLCRLLEGLRRPIRTEGTVPEFLGKTPYRDASGNLEHNGVPESASESLPKLEWSWNGVQGHPLGKMDRNNMH